MGYQVLARKWRPGKFSELVGQEHVVRAISNALDNNRLHHAYLFTGTRGVGKTTIARIFSRSLNCETGVSSNPCGVCPACIDIEKGNYVDLIEIDAASRTKVEDTREILDNVQYRPTRGEYKVYLIDEVHMLSKHSFNALLKTLEEPPPHIKFLLATTDPQKLPITILSRCLQFNLKALTREQIGGQLSHILRAEDIAFETKALELLARSAHGSMRDALSLTDQAIAQGNGQVMPDIVAEMLGLIDADQISNLVSAILGKDKTRVLKVSSELALMGTDFKAVLAELMSVFHQIALTQFVPEACKLETSQARQIYGWARTVTPELVQLYYQIALQGRKDIEWAQDLKVGFEMAIMRMMAFTPEAIKTDVADLQVAAKEANQTHNEQFASPPQSLLVHDEGEKHRQQAERKSEAEQKKNDLVDEYSSPRGEPGSSDKGDEQSKSEKKRQQERYTQPGALSVESEAHESELTNVKRVHTGSAETIAEADTSVDKEAKRQHRSLTAEMDAVIQEAHELRPIATESDPQKPQKATEIENAESIANDFSAASQTEVPQYQKEQLSQREPQIPQKQMPDMSGIDDYADYDSLQQASEQEDSELTTFDDMEQGSSDVETQSGLSAFSQQVQQTPEVKGSTANTHDLLNLMQTLNQATTESGDTLQDESHEQPEEQHKKLQRKSQAEHTEVNTSSAETSVPDADLSSLAEPKLKQAAAITCNDDESHNKLPAALWGTSEHAPFQIEPVEEFSLSTEPAQPDTLKQASYNEEAKSYSDDLFQSDLVARSQTASDSTVIAERSTVTTQEEPSEPAKNCSPESASDFFSPQQMVDSQQEDSPPWDTSESDTQQQSSHTSIASEITDSHRVTEDYFSPDASLSDDQHAASHMGYENQVLPQSGEHHGLEGTEEEWHATDIAMSVDFDIPFAVDGKKVTKASQLDTWSQLIERAGLGGLTKQLALNSNYFNDGEHIRLVVSTTQNHLMSENVIKTIEESISDAIQQPIKLQASMGEVIDTPAAVQKAINEMRQQHAEKTIQQDGAVADICHSFSGTVLQGTVKPR